MGKVLIHLLLRLFWLVLGFATLGCLAVTLAGFGGRWHWYADLFNHWRPQYALAAGLALLFFFMGRKPFGGALALLTLGLNGLVLWPHTQPLPAPPPPPVPGRPPVRLRVASLNVLDRNRDFAAVERWLRQEQPDVVAFQEAISHWRQMMPVWRNLYPYQSIGTREGFSELVLISKHPLKNLRRVALGPMPHQAGLAADIEIGGGAVSILTLHAMHPTSAFKVRLVREQHEGLITWSQQQRQAGHAVVVLGDFNCTPWSEHFKRMGELSQLQDSSRGSTFAATWQPWMPWQLLIDHVLFSGDWFMTGRTVGPPVGSDHRPVVVQLEHP